MTTTPMTAEELVELMAEQAWNESQFCEPGEDWNSQTHKMQDVFRNYFSDGLHALEAAGQAVVPREATHEMARAGMAADFKDPMGAVVQADCYKHWRAMLAAGAIRVKP